MTADIVNLRRARKTKARLDATDVATANRVKFGLSSVERKLLEARSALFEKQLDHHRLDEHRIGDSGRSDAD